MLLHFQASRRVCVEVHASYSFADSGAEERIRGVRRNRGIMKREGEPRGLACGVAVDAKR